MRDDRFVRAYSQIKPDEEAKARMLSNILAAKTRESQPAEGKTVTRIHKILPVLCTAAVFVFLFTVSKIQRPVQKDNRLMPNNQLAVAQKSEAPSGMRKMMNYGGRRYAFLDNGAPYTLEENALSDALGTLEYDITQDPEAYGAAEFASTFAVGGTIYRLADYDPQFRVAVKWQDQYYLAECVDTLDGTDVDISEFFASADFAETVAQINICDHAGRTVLYTLPDDQTEKMLLTLSQSCPAKPTAEQYQQIARAQQDGNSYRLCFVLQDETEYTMYVIPALSLASLGDNYYTLTSDFSNSFDSIFQDLDQPVLPAG